MRYLPIALALQGIIVFISISSSTFAQKPTDQIHKADGTVISAKVLEITNTEIKYKKASNPDGPTYTILKTDAVKIIYANGEEEVYSNNPTQAKMKTPGDEVRFDADNFVAFSDDGRSLLTDLTMADGKTYLCSWDLTLKLRKKIIFDNRRRYQGIYNWQLMANDGSYLNSYNLYDANDKLTVTFTNPKTGQSFANDGNGSIISPDGKRVMVKAADGKGPMFLFDNKGTLLKTIKIESFSGLGAWKFSHNSKYLLFSGQKGIGKKGFLTVLDADGNQVSEIILEIGWDDAKYYPYNRYGYYGLKSYIIFSFDDSMIIAPNNDESVGIWDIKGNLIRSLSHFRTKMSAISRDGQTIVTVGGLPFGKEESINGKTFSGGQVKIWSVDGSLIKEIPFPVNPSSVEFLPDDSGFVVTVDGLPIWLRKGEGYTLPDGYDQILPGIAKSQDEERAAQRADEKRKRHADLWGGLATGFVKGMANYEKEMGRSSMQTAAAEKLINTTVNKGLTDCHYVVFTQINKDDKLAVSDIFKITRGCELNAGNSNVKFADTYEELAKWVEAIMAKEFKDNTRSSVRFEAWNNHFKNGAVAGQGGCLCK